MCTYEICRSVKSEMANVELFITPVYKSVLKISQLWAADLH